MPRSIEQVIAWTRDPANRNRHQGGNWHNRCQQYINNAGDFNSSFDTAWLAAQASGPLTKSLGGIRDGAVGYWRGVWIDGEECGHDAFWYQGVWWMASDACGEARDGQGEQIGNGTGWITATEYARLRPAAIWQGWTIRHGTETLAGASTAGGNINDLGDIDMATAEEIAQAIWTHMLTQTGGQKGSGRAADWLVNLPDQVGPKVWDQPLTHKSGTKGTAREWLLNTSDMVGAILSKPSTTIDPVKLAAELAKAGLTVNVDSAAIVKALDASLRDDFAAIPGAVRSAIIK